MSFLETCSGLVARLMPSQKIKIFIHFDFGYVCLGFFALNEFHRHARLRDVSLLAKIRSNGQCRKSLPTDPLPCICSPPLASPAAKRKNRIFTTLQQARFVSMTQSASIYLPLNTTYVGVVFYL